LHSRRCNFESCTQEKIKGNKRRDGRNKEKKGKKLINGTNTTGMKTKVGKQMRVGRKRRRTK
jgi:hypothetical protein